MNKRMIALSICLAAVLLALGFGLVLAAEGYSFFGDAMLVSPGSGSPAAVQLRSSNSVQPGYGGIDFGVPAGMTLSSLSTLATDYDVTAGGCGGGSPRFQVNLSNGLVTKNMFVYIGPPPNYTGCTLNVWANTGNLVSGATSVDTSQLGGAFYDTYAHAQSTFGSYTITGIQLVVDGNWAVSPVQTVLVDNVNINGTVYTFEDKGSCKQDGWKTFTSAPGPFKNQGDCVSYFETGK